MASEFGDGAQIEGSPKLGSNSEPCPYIRSSGDGTHWCALAERPAEHREVMRLALEALWTCDYADTYPESQKFDDVKVQAAITALRKALGGLDE